jgi:hypothetical protein
MFTMISTIENKTDEIINQYFDKKRKITDELAKKEIFEIDQKLHEIELIIHKYNEEKNKGQDLEDHKNEIFDSWIKDHAVPFRKFLNSCKMVSCLKDFLIEYENSKSNISTNHDFDKFIKDYFNSNINWFESFFN